MATVTAQQIVDAAGILLHDTDHDRWSEDELLADLNDGEKAIVLLKPDSYVNSTSFQLAAGVYQSIPSGGIQFLSRAAINMGTDGSTLGQSITFAEKDDIDTHNPDWPTDDASATVIAIMFDPKYPKKFLCYPPQPSSNMGYIRWPYSYSPTDIAAIGNTINLDDIYKEPLIQWLLYKSYARDKEDAANQALSDDARNEFYRLLGIKDQKEQTEGP